MLEAPEPEEGAGELKESEVVARMLVVADEDRAALGQPGKRPLHHPTSGRLALRGRRPAIPDLGDVRLVVPTERRAPAGVGDAPMARQAASRPGADASAGLGARRA